MGRDGEGSKKEVKGWKGRGKDFPDQCQTASYAPVAADFSSIVKLRHRALYGGEVFPVAK